MAVAIPSIAGASLTTAGGNLVINKPSGVVAGDFLICFIICSINTTITPPSDTVPWNTDVSAAGIRAYSKIAGSSEPSSYTFTRASGINNIMGIIIRVTGAHAVDPIDTLGAQVGGSGSTVVLPSVNVTDGFDLIQIAEIQAVTTFTPPSGPAEIFDQQFASQNFAAAVGLETVSAGATGTRTWTAGGSGVRSGVMYAIIDAAVDASVIVPDAATATAQGEIPDVSVGGSVSFTVPNAAEATGQGQVPTVTAEILRTSITNEARLRAAAALSILEPELSTKDTGWLLREYWGRRAGIVGDLSTYSVNDIIAVHFPGSHFIRDVV